MADTERVNDIAAPGVALEAVETGRGASGAVLDGMSAEVIKEAGGEAIGAVLRLRRRVFEEGGVVRGKSEGRLWLGVLGAEGIPEVGIAAEGPESGEGKDEEEHGGGECLKPPAASKHRKHGPQDKKCHVGQRMAKTRAER